MYLDADIFRATCLYVTTVLSINVRPILRFLASTNITLPTILAYVWLQDVGIMAISGLGKISIIQSTSTGPPQTLEERRPYWDWLR